MATILIGCKLPHGIVLKGSAGQAVKINGANTSLLAGGFGITHVEENEAAYLFAVHEDFAPFKSNAIFTHETAKVADLKSIAAELSDVATGFEALDPEAPAPGLKPDGDVNKMLALNDKQPRPVKAPASQADKAAANELAGV